MLNIVCDPNIGVTNVFHHWSIMIAQLVCFACQSDIYDWYSTTGECHCHAGLPCRVYEGFAIELSICLTIWGPVRTPAVEGVNFSNPP